MLVIGMKPVRQADIAFWAFVPCQSPKDLPLQLVEKTTQSSFSIDMAKTVRSFAPVFLNSLFYVATIEPSLLNRCIFDFSFAFEFLPILSENWTKLCPIDVFLKWKSDTHHAER